jgi:hypothetical protein
MSTRDSSILRIGEHIFVAIRWISPYYWYTKLRAVLQRRRYEDFFTRRSITNYVVGWLLVLAAVVLLVRPGRTAERFVVTAFVILRLSDILLASIDDAFSISPRNKNRRNLTRGFPILIGSLNLMQAWLGFAALYLMFGSMHAFSPEAFGSRSTALYVSLTDLTTLGNGYVPKSGAVVALTMSESAFGLLLIGILFTAFMSRREDEEVQAQFAPH